MEKRERCKTEILERTKKRQPTSFMFAQASAEEENTKIQAVM
jgi:hypothetical protein